MTYQPSFSQAEFATKKKITRREKFLARMETLIPWTQLLAVIEPFYPKGERGRPPIGLERMLRVYFLQQWYALADETLEDALYDSQALQGFARIDLADEGVPLLEEIDAQHPLQSDGRTTALAFGIKRFNDGEQLLPRDERLHACKERLPAGDLLLGSILNLRKTRLMGHTHSLENSHHLVVRFSKKY